MEVEIEELEYITLTDLKGRGWTTKMIKMFYDIPDKIKSNPRFRNASSMKLYLLSNIEEKEKNKEWLEYFDKIKESRLKQKNRALEANEKKRKELVNYINNIKINIKSFSKDKLYLKAVYHYNNLWYSRGDYDKHASIKDDSSFLKRISVNFLRHDLTKYEKILSNMYGKVGINIGYVLLKNKILDNISETYDFLKEECEKQKVI